MTAFQQVASLDVKTDNSDLVSSLVSLKELDRGKNNFSIIAKIQEVIQATNVNNIIIGNNAREAQQEFIYGVLETFGFFLSGCDLVFGCHCSPL
jgi:hypothetical protein